MLPSAPSSPPQSLTIGRRRGWFESPCKYTRMLVSACSSSFGDDLSNSTKMRRNPSTPLHLICSNLHAPPLDRAEIKICVFFPFDARFNRSDLASDALATTFASQFVYSCKKLGLDHGKVNVNGGVIDLGHPLGATEWTARTKVYDRLHDHVGAKTRIIKLLSRLLICIW
ncbi:hypothetical protein V6N11_065847 [Hibiscus sabdariffa]|uniref:Thiolase C-terminal domain-containing protein n=1 Tax=Hibiscus sabdariffa TaxID=183260 RepID=A0ABR2PIJ3_9ROSI